MSSQKIDHTIAFLKASFVKAQSPIERKPGYDALKLHQSAQPPISAKKYFPQ